ncbi:hypothetical protein [Sporotomaculum syntrophicum]|uniref:hypothetical protein n=1 Tax=Sporotomaculum syntrophicum TaxID=182264 RepID=UPI00192A5163|nr:hypothetical protein [Sporotomaculum syntrophicum]
MDYAELSCYRRCLSDSAYLRDLSFAHGAMASYLLNELYANELSENAQYLRNVMYGRIFCKTTFSTFICSACRILFVCRITRLSRAEPYGCKAKSGRQPASGGGLLRPASAAMKSWPNEAKKNSSCI